jgi:enoyl-CoA hydratase/carnithine racemase
MIRSTALARHRILRCRLSSATRTSTRSSSSTSTSTALLHSVKDEYGVLTLSLNRPEQRNALNRPLLELLQQELVQASTSSDIRAIVLQSEGPDFSSGHDLKELSSTITNGEESSSEEEQLELFRLCSDVMKLLPSMPQPTICAVQGLATAAGCQLVAACDLAIANPKSGFCTPGVTLGLFCHTPAVPLVRCVGIKRAMHMLYTGQVITAQEALDYGLITQIKGNARKEAQKVAQQLASQSACAMKLGKRTLHEQASASSLDEAYEIASRAMVENLKYRDAQHGIESFLENKPPTWKHD